MKMTFERWLTIAFVGCLAIGVAILPATGVRELFSWLDVKTRSPEDIWQLRMQARVIHFGDVARIYRQTFELIEAQRAFGSTQGKVGAPEVHFSAEVPQAFRNTFMRALDEERSEQHEWTGRGKVGVLVLIDTSARVNGVELQRLRSWGNSVTTRVVPPSAATGNRCVTVVSIPNGDPWSRLLEGRPIGPMHPLLDACGFYDAFGAPGSQIQNELISGRFQFARGYQPAAPPDTVKHPSEYHWGWGGVDAGTHLGRCLAGADTTCLDLWVGAGTSSYYRMSGEAPRVEWPGITVQKQPWRSIQYVTQLSRAVIAVGPQRFETIWQSPKSLEAAYFDETGQTLPDFIRTNMAVDVGSYRAGPYTTWLTTALTLLTIAAALGVALRFSPRPKVA